MSTSAVQLITWTPVPAEQGGLPSEQVARLGKHTASVWRKGGENPYRGMVDGGRQTSHWQEDSAKRTLEGKLIKAHKADVARESSKESVAAS